MFSLVGLSFYELIIVVHQPLFSIVYADEPCDLIANALPKLVRAAQEFVPSFFGSPRAVPLPQLQPFVSRADRVSAVSLEVWQISLIKEAERNLPLVL